MTSFSFQHLASGYDTIECAYYLTISDVGSGIDYVALIAERDAMRLAKMRYKTIELATLNAE